MRISQEIIHIDGTDAKGNKENSCLVLNRCLDEELLLVKIVDCEKGTDEIIYIDFYDLKKAIDKLAL